MSSKNFEYLRNEFSFVANKNNPKGLDFRGLDEISRMQQKIDIRTVQDQFCPNGEMKAKPYQDYLFEIKRTKRRLNTSLNAHFT